MNFIQSNVLNSSDLCSLKTGNRDTLIPVRFEPDIERLLMSHLEVYQTLLNVPGGASCKVGIQVSNSTNHDIVLKKRTAFGKLQQSNLLLH